MTAGRACALLAALALAGCVSTKDEPFPLDDGAAIAPAATDYVCDSFDVRGKRQHDARRGRILALRRNQKSQYALLESKSASSKSASSKSTSSKAAWTQPFTLHKASGDLYIAAMAHADAPGEDLYLVEITKGGEAFRLFVESDDFPSRAQGLAQDHGVTLTHNPLTNDLAGPVSGEKAFMIDMAANAAAWTVTTECRAKR